MTATAHALIGAVIAAKIADPVLAIPIALFSHVAADMFPHWDVGTNRRKKTKQKMQIQAAGDVVVGFILSYMLIVFFFPHTNLLYAFVMIIVAQSLDWLMAPYYFFGIKQFKWAYTFGKETNKELDKPWGIIGQVAVIGALILIAILL